MKELISNKVISEVNKCFDENETEHSYKDGLGLPRTVRVIETESRTVVMNGELVFDGCRVSVWDVETVLEMGGGDGCTTA